MKGSKDFKELLKKYNIIVHNEALYNEALTHTSYANEQDTPDFNYERLEFMGDAVFQIVSAEFVYKKYKKERVGYLTKIRSQLVRSASFAKLGRELGIDRMINLGNSVEKDRFKNDRIIEDVVEAFLGAVYLDAGFVCAKKLATIWLKQILKEVDEEVVDYKSMLQELIQIDKKDPLEYVITKEIGKDNDKLFFCDVMLGGLVLGKGEGKSKKAAEVQAAKMALEKMAK